VIIVEDLVPAVLQTVEHQCFLFFWVCFPFTFGSDFSCVPPGAAKLELAVGEVFVFFCFSF